MINVRAISLHAVTATLCAALTIASSFDATAQSSVMRTLTLSLTQPTNGAAVTMAAAPGTAMQALAMPDVLPGLGMGIKASTVSGTSVGSVWEGVGSSGLGTGSGAGVVNALPEKNNIGGTYETVFTAALVANTAYVISGRFFAETGNSTPPDLGLNWVLPVGATITFTIISERTGETFTATPAVLDTPLTNTSYPVTVTGVVTMGATAGNVILQGEKVGGGAASDIAVGGYMTFIP
jgi:hypothetical protein